MELGAALLKGTGMEPDSIAFGVEHLNRWYEDAENVRRDYHMRFAPPCHPNADFRVEYSNSIMSILLYCSECRKKVMCIAVADHSLPLIKSQ